MNVRGCKSISEDFFKNISEFEHFWLLAIDVVDSCHQDHVHYYHFVSSGDQTSSFQDLVSWHESFGHDKRADFYPLGFIFHHNTWWANWTCSDNCFFWMNKSLPLKISPAWMILHIRVFIPTTSKIIKRMDLTYSMVDFPIIFMTSLALLHLRSRRSKGIKWKEK